MQVIPAINAATFEELTRQLAFIKQHIPEHHGMIHLDVTDGSYSAYPLWNNPEDLRNPESEIQDRQFEVHLMVQHPERVIDQWLLPCVGRILIHPDASERLEEIIERCNNQHIEIGFSFAPGVSADDYVSYLGHVAMVQVLAVKPGAPGQSFEEDSLHTVRVLRGLFPSGILEVDGGVTPEIAAQVKEVGADAVVSASYIMKSSDPRKAYQELSSV